MPRFVNRWWMSIVTVLVLFFVIQILPYGQTRTNPPVTMEPAWNSLTTRDLAKRACFDCHSNATRWPGYARVAPVSWLILHDVQEGRAALNFSEWDRPQKEAKEAAEEVREGQMPGRVYRLMHAEARLSDSERDQLASGLDDTFRASTRQHVEP